MKRILASLLLSTALVGCNEIKGVVDVKSSLDITNNKNKQVAVGKGQYRAEFKYDQGDRELEIKIKEVDGKDQKVKIKVPNGVIVPEYSGDFAITAAQSKQAFDLKGKLDTKTTISDRKYVRESCTRYVRDCGYHRRGRFCRDFPIHGYRDVIYRVKTTDISLKSQFYVPTTTTLLADFDGGQSYYETIYEHYGQCF